MKWLSGVSFGLGLGLLAPVLALGLVSLAVEQDSRAYVNAWSVVRP